MQLTLPAVSPLAWVRHIAVGPPVSSYHARGNIAARPPVAAGGRDGTASTAVCPLVTKGDVGDTAAGPPVAPGCGRVDGTRLLVGKIGTTVVRIEAEAVVNAVAVFATAAGRATNSYETFL